jgi:DNA-directed RNA polymerase subunit RPC12/RpoP
MTDYKKYINALRKCAKEHDDDFTSFRHIRVSDLCRDTANLLEMLEQESCDDCVSRKAVLEMAKSYNTDGWDMYTPLVVDVEDIEELPPVIPISPKGHWREVDTNMYACSKCSHVLTIDPLDNSILEMNTCPFCSAKMEGVVEEI